MLLLREWRLLLFIEKLCSETVVFRTPLVVGSLIWSNGVV